MELLAKCGRKPTLADLDDDPESVVEKMRREGSEVAVFALEDGTLRYVHFGALLVLSTQQPVAVEAIETGGHSPPVYVHPPASELSSGWEPEGLKPTSVKKATGPQLFERL